MRAPSIRPSWLTQPLAWIVAGLLTALYGLILFVPWQPPMVSMDAEPSFNWALNLGFLQHTQFGRDFVFTFGPYGFLYYHVYHPATFTLVLVAWALLFLVFLAAFWRVARAATDNAALAFGAIALLFPLIAATTDTYILFFCILALLHHFTLDGPRAGPVTWALAAALALSGLVKFMFFIIAAVVITLISVSEIRRVRRAPVAAIAFVGALVILWLLAGQQIGGLIPWLVRSFQVSSGYTEGMALDKPLIEPVSYLAAAIPLVVWIGRIEWLRLGRWASLPLAGYGAVLFLAFKHGFVRYDGIDAGPLLVGVVVVYAAINHSRLTCWLDRCLGGAALVFALACASICFAQGWHRTVPGYLLETWRSIPKTAALAARFVGGANPLPQEYETIAARIRREKPLPPIRGSVDLYHYNQGVILAHGLRYDPRPVIQSYLAYTEALAELNAEHLRGPRAPDQILFKITPVDDHYPALEDNLSWPELLTRYNVAGLASDFLLLDRAESARPFRLVPAGELTARFDDPIAVPAYSDGPLWARIDLQPTVLGRLARFLFKTPVVFLDVVTEDGMAQRFRLLPALARTGFVLSPLVDNAYSFAALGSTESRRDLQAAAVKTCRVSTSSLRGQRLCFQPDVRVSFHRLDFAKQDLSAVPELAGLARRTLALRQLRLGLVRSAGAALALDERGQPLLFALPYSVFTWTVPSDAAQVAVAFGLLDKSWNGRLQTQGVEFRVSARAGDGPPRLLWSRLLDPVARPADRGPQRAVIEFAIPAGAQLLFETGTGQPSSANWAYWSDVAVETRR